ncbi:hypothetical protein [Paenibacillus lactis]
MTAYASSIEKTQIRIQLVVNDLAVAVETWRFKASDGKNKKEE